MNPNCVVNYGNSLTLDLSYSNRLRASQYDLKTSSGARVMGLQYQYDTSGLTTTSTDLVNSNLNRNYTYDHAGKMTLGDTANGTLNGPYKQTYGYDVWGNPTYRSWRTFGYNSYCQCTYPITNESWRTFSNNRDTTPGWSYDAEGRLTSRLAKGRENPVQLEANPIAPAERANVLERIQQYSPGIDPTFWEAWLGS